MSNKKETNLPGQSSPSVSYLDTFVENEETDSGEIRFKSQVQLKERVGVVKINNLDSTLDSIEDIEDYAEDGEALCAPRASTPIVGETALTFSPRPIASPVPTANPSQGLEEIMSLLQILGADFKQSQQSLRAEVQQVKHGQEAGQQRLGEVQQTLRSEMQQVQQSQETGQQTLRAEIQQGQQGVHNELVGLQLCQQTLLEEIIKVKQEFREAQDKQTLQLRDFYAENIIKLKDQIRQEIIAESARLKAEMMADQEGLSCEIKKVSGDLQINSNTIKNEITKISLEMKELNKISEDNLRGIINGELTQVKKRLNNIENLGGAQHSLIKKVTLSKQLIKQRENRPATEEDTEEEGSGSETSSDNLDFVDHNRPSKGMNYLLHGDKPIFEGGNPKRFLENLEGYLRNARITGREAVQNFHVFLRGKALQWWGVAGKKGGSWNRLKEQVMAYWFDKAKLKTSWARLECRPQGDVERFVFQALDIQNSLRPERSEEKKIQKVAHKLPSPIREFVLMKDAKTIEQFLTDVRQVESFHKPAESSSVYYNSKYKNNSNSSGGNGRQSPYNWDQNGNAYTPDGKRVWQSKGKDLKKGPKQVNAVAVTVSDPNLPGSSPPPSSQASPVFQPSPNAPIFQPASPQFLFTPQSSAQPTPQLVSQNSQQVVLNL